MIKKKYYSHTLLVSKIYLIVNAVDLWSLNARDVIILREMIDNPNWIERLELLLEMDNDY